MHNRTRTRWHGPRNFRLGCLVMLGWTPEQIAGDELIQSTPEAVRRHVYRMGGEFRDRPLQALSMSVSDAFDEEGRRYALRGNDLIYKTLRILAAQPDLLHTVCQKGGLRDTLCSSSS